MMILHPACPPPPLWVLQPPCSCCLWSWSSPPGWTLAWTAARIMVSIMLCQQTNNSPYQSHRLSHWAVWCTQDPACLCHSQNRTPCSWEWKQTLRRCCHTSGSITHQHHDPGIEIVNILFQNKGISKRWRSANRKCKLELLSGPTAA